MLIAPRSHWRMMSQHTNAEVNQRCQELARGYGAPGIPGICDTVLDSPAARSIAELVGSLPENAGDRATAVAGVLDAFREQLEMAVAEQRFPLAQIAAGDITAPAWSLGLLRPVVSVRRDDRLLAGAS